MVFHELGRILKKTALGKECFSLWLETTKIAKNSSPGQFVAIRLPSASDPFLRRPLAIADTQEMNLRIIFKIRGRGTQILSEKHEGDFVSILGPLGNPIPSFENKEVVIVGGGIGIAPLLYLVKNLASEKKILVFLGAKTQQELILRDEFWRLSSEIYLCTEDGELGEKGLVTDIIQSYRNKIPKEGVIFAGGPLPMYRRLRSILSNKIYAFLEERMGCGTGLCLSCAVPKKEGGYLHLCKDGPVIDLEAINL